jgi:hypothetical protein
MRKGTSHSMKCHHSCSGRASRARGRLNLLGATLNAHMSDEKQIGEALVLLGQVGLFELKRPAVGHDETPTVELVNWAVKMYCFSLIAHFREMLSALLTLVEKRGVPAGFVIARCLYEMAAHSHYTHKHVLQYLEKNEIKGAWAFLTEINMGSRYMREEYGDRPAEWPEFAAPREIAKVMKCFNEWAGNGKATTEYSFISEFAHPNMAAFSHYYRMEPDAAGIGKVVFIDPPRDTSAVPWPIVSISVVSSLHFVLRLLQRVGEKQIAQHLETILVKFG